MSARYATAVVGGTATLDVDENREQGAHQKRTPCFEQVPKSGAVDFHVPTA